MKNQEGNLSIQFKGNRQYVHGPTIFDKTIELLGEKKILFDRADLVISKMVNQMLNYVITENLNEIASYPIRFEFVSFGSFTSYESKFYVGLIENDIPIAQSYEYDEDSIITSAIIDQGLATITLNELSFTNSETITAMNKHLLLTLRPELSGKWLFVKLSVVQEFLQLPKEISLQLVAATPRITNTKILFDGRHVGNVYFSLLKA